MSVMCSKPSTPPRSMNAPKSVMFLTTPLRTWLTDNSFISTSRFVLRSASSSTRRDTTMLRRRLFNLMILNSKLWPSSSSMFGTRRSAIWLPGRNASTPMRSTTTPPLIFFTSVPATASSFSCASRIFSQTRMKSAFFFDRTTAPSWSSRCSRKTSTSSPSFRLFGSLNSSIATAPSDLEPTARMTAVSVTRSTFDLTISPSSIFESVPSYSRVILSISSEEYSSSRPERTRSGERGALRVGTSSSESSMSRASTSIRYTGSVVGLRFVFTLHCSHPQRVCSAIAVLKDSVGRAQASAWGPTTGGNLPREQFPRQFDHPCHLLLEREGGGVEQDGVRSGRQRGDPPVGIGRIPRREGLAFLSDQLEVDRLAPLKEAPPGPLVGRRSQKDLQRRLREDDRADVPPVDHHPAIPTGLHRQPLLGIHPGPHLGKRRKHRNVPGDAFAADRILDVRAGHLRPERVRREHQTHRQPHGEIHDVLRGPLLSLAASALTEIVERRQRERAVERAGIEVRPPQSLGDETRRRAFPGRRGAVDGNYSKHRRRSRKNMG